MFRYFAKRLYKMIADRVYSGDVVLILEHKHNTNQSSPAEIKEVNESNIADVLSFQTPSQVSIFKKFLKDGQKGFYGYVENKCVHRSWVVLGPGPVRLHKFSKVKLTSDEIFIEYCETAPTMRGKNIFAHVLSCIAQQYMNKRILISVNADNLSSLKSIKKAGFVEIKRVSIKMIMGFKSVQTK